MLVTENCLNKITPQTKEKHLWAIFCQSSVGPPGRLPILWVGVDTSSHPPAPPCRSAATAEEAAPPPGSLPSISLPWPRLSSLVNYQVAFIKHRPHCRYWARVLWVPKPTPHTVTDGISPGGCRGQHQPHHPQPRDPSQALPGSAYCFSRVSVYM